MNSLSTNHKHGNTKTQNKSTKKSTNKYINSENNKNKPNVNIYLK